MPLNHTSKFADLTDDQYAGIGRAVVEWANVEVLLGAVLSRLLLTPDFLGRTFTQSASASRLQTEIVEAAEIHARRYRYRFVSEELLHEILEINASVTIVRAMRNKFAHFCWVRSNDDEVWGTSFPGGVPSASKDRKAFVKLSTQDLVTLNQRVHTLVERLLTVREKLPEVREEASLGRNGLLAPE